MASGNITVKVGIVGSEATLEALRQTSITLQELADAFAKLAEAFAVSSVSRKDIALDGEASDDRNLREHNES